MISAREAGAKRRRRRKIWGKVIYALLFMAGAISILTTIGIVYVLAAETINFFKQVSFSEFMFTAEWAPLFKPERYGVLPLVSGTLLVSLGAILIAAPIGLGAAIYLSEYAPSKLRDALKPSLEILAGIPTVVYGFFALVFITPLIREFWPDANIFNALSASIVMAVMVTPMIFTISEDAMRAVPRGLREAAYGLGATKRVVSLRIVVPAALSGIIASFILAISRAIGETMIVVIAAGASPNLTLNPL